MTGKDVDNLSVGSYVRCLKDNVGIKAGEIGRIVRIDLCNPYGYEISFEASGKPLGTHFYNGTELQELFEIANITTDEDHTVKVITSKTDDVEHPSHYTWLKDVCGVEPIDIIRHFDYDIGAALKYLFRAGHKKQSGITDRQKEINDLQKAVWYIQDKIKTLEGE